MPIINDPDSKQRYQALGEHVKRLRDSQGLGLREAARHAQVDPTWWRRLEAGYYVTPDAHGIAKVARVLGIDMEELYHVAGLSNGRTLPSLDTYLRAKFDLPPEAIAQLQAHFELLNDKYQKKGEDDGRNDLNAA